MWDPRPPPALTTPPQLSQVWTQPEVGGVRVAPRAGHAGAVLGSKWFIVGGGNNVAGLTDMLALDLSALGQQQQQQAGGGAGGPGGKGHGGSGGGHGHGNGKVVEAPVQHQVRDTLHCLSLMTPCRSRSLKTLKPQTLYPVP